MGFPPLAEGLGDVPPEQEPSEWVGWNKASAFLRKLLGLRMAG